MTRRQLCSTAIVAWSLSPTSIVCGQEPALGKSVMPIEITAVPGKILPGGTVAISGTTGLVGDKSAVTMQIASPDGKLAPPLVVKPSSDGAFSATFRSTKAPGTYQVAATAPDGKGKGATTFAVVAVGVIPAEIAARTEALIIASERAITRARKALEDQPVSPPRDEAREKLIAVEQRLEQAPTQVATIKKAMDQAFGARYKIPESIPEWDQYLGELGTWEHRAETAKERLEDLAESSAQAAEGCGDLQRIADAVAMVSEVLNIVQIPMDKSAGYWTDKIPAGLASRGLDPAKATNTDKFAAVQTMKLAAAIFQGPKGWLTAAAGAALDVGLFIVNETFDRYCVKFEGPIKGTFVGEAITRAGEFFWSYTIKLDGKIVLMYPKGTPSGRPVSLQGFIEGAGDFAVRDDPTPINRLVPGIVLFHKVTSPPGGRYLDEIGSGMGGMAPHSFRLPVKGILAADSIVISVQPATFDFADIIKGHLIWVVWPTGGMWPEIIDAPIQLQKAHPIFERVIRRRPVLRIKQEGSFAVARGEFARDTTSADRTAHVSTTLTLKACNPGCVPLPLSPASKNLP